MESILLNWVARVLLWTLGIYFTIYCLNVYINEKNVLFASTMHLFLILFSVMLMSGPPGTDISGF